MFKCTYQWATGYIFKRYVLVPKDCFVLANSADLGEITHFAEFVSVFTVFVGAFSFLYTNAYLADFGLTLFRLRYLCVSEQESS